MVELDPAQVVGAGGALGAVLRSYVGRRVDAGEVPLSTFTVNVVGSFALGLLAFLHVDDTTMLLLGTGACGSFTTFSSFSFESVRLWETGRRELAVANAVGNLAGAGVAVGAAWALAQAV